ncbi:MAG: mandelate racemase/muconate lactonizing enzyme family protein [Acidimicrobiales bacterium]
MKITDIETFVVDAGWRPWQFVAVRTDVGITGYGECSDGRSPYGVVGAVDDFVPLVLGRDPRAAEAIYWDLYRAGRQSPVGIAAKAIAGIELALWDIKGKALGVPVHELFGGPVRERQRVYWSHCGSSRAGNAELLGTPPIDSYDAFTALGREVTDRGFTALKTNVVIPGSPAVGYGFGFGGGPPDQTVPVDILDRIEEQLAAFTAGVGPGVEIALDLNFNYKPEAAAKICRIAERFPMLWVEIDMYEPAALRELKDQTSVPITSGENLYGVRDYRRYFDARSMDNVMIDIPWNGFARSRDVAMLAESHELNVAPHNYYSHLSTHIALHFCATVPNVKIMEIDIDDVPWKDDLTGGPLEFSDGTLAIPTGPGWGIDLDEDVARDHVWERGRGPGYTAAGADHDR